LSDDASDVEGGIPEEEELIQTGNDDHPEKALICSEPSNSGGVHFSKLTHNPCAKSTDGYGRIISVGYGRPHLGIRGVILCDKKFIMRFMGSGGEANLEHQLLLLAHRCLGHRNQQGVELRLQLKVTKDLE
jgi:hypothetical protein